VRAAEAAAPDDAGRAALRTLRAVVLARANDFARKSPEPTELAFALEELGRALEGMENPRERSELLVLRSRVLRRQGRLGESLEQVEAALRGFPGQHELRFFRGLTLARLGRAAEAIAELQAFGQEANDGSTRHLWCGVELWELERSAARQTLQRYFELNVEAAPGWRVRLASLLEPGEREEALRLLAEGSRIAKRTKPEDAEWLEREAEAARVALEGGDSAPLRRLVARLEAARGRLLGP